MESTMNKLEQFFLVSMILIIFAVTIASIIFASRENVKKNKRLHQLFIGEKVTPSLLFIDELTAITVEDSTASMRRYRIRSWDKRELIWNTYYIITDKDSVIIALWKDN